MEGDVILTPMAQANGQHKVRPAVILRLLPPFDDALVCGISTQLHQQVAGFDETISPVDNDFQTSGLAAASLIRLGYLALITKRELVLTGAIGTIAPERHERLLRTLSNYLTAKL